MKEIVIPYLNQSILVRTNNPEFIKLGNIKSGLRHKEENGKDYVIMDFNLKAFKDIYELINNVVYRSIEAYRMACTYLDEENSDMEETFFEDSIAYITEESMRYLLDEYK